MPSAWLLAPHRPFFTGDAFDRNLENFYWIRIPAIVERMTEQFEYLWDEIATAQEDLPEEDVTP